MKKTEKELIGMFGNPGIWLYCKESEYDAFIKALNEHEYFHDLERSNNEITKTVYKDFQFKNTITESDYSAETLTDDDIIVHIWCVQNKYKKTENEQEIKTISG